MIQQIISLLTTPPGNLIYHLGLTISIFGAFLSVKAQVNLAANQENRGLYRGLILLICSQLTLFAISGLTWQGLILSEKILPPLDRAITVFNLFWIAWIWIGAKRTKLANVLLVIAHAFIGIFLIANLIIWKNDASGIVFNQSWLSQVWELFGLMIVLVGSVLLIMLQPPLWETGTAFMFVVAVGYLGQLITNLPDSDFPGVVRFSLIAAYPLLLVLPQKTVSESSIPQKRAKNTPHPITQERRRYSTDTKTLEAFLQLASQTTIPNLPASVCRVISHAMLADLSFLVTLPDTAGAINLEGGYDLIREETLSGVTLNPNRIPQITSALQKGRPLYLYRENTGSTDLETLAVSLGIPKTGNLLLVPFFDGDSKPVGGILLLSPYANRVWNVDDQIFLQPVGKSLVRVLHRLHGNANLQSELDRALIDLDTMQASYQQLRQNHQEMLEKYEALRMENQDSISQQDNLESVIAIQQEYQGIISHLQEENERLQKVASKALNALPDEDDDETPQNKDLAEALQKIDQLEQALTSAAQNASGSTPGTVGEQPAQESIAKVISIAHELRQPLTSISGYVDLLMTESVGILGSIQKKFLERIQVSTERMVRLTDDLVQEFELGIEKINHGSNWVNFSEIIDEGMSAIRDGLATKDINLEVNIESDLPLIPIDHDVLFQISAHLLQNALEVTPPGGTIRLGAQVQTENEIDEYLLFQIMDTGPGIAVEDLPRVFSQRHRDAGVQIPGIGNLGIELAVAKVLADANHGRIWVDSEVGTSTTFSVLLPIQSTVTPNPATEG